MAIADPQLLVDAMNRLWTQYRPQIEARVAVLETAASALADGSLTAAQCEQASAAAHKLAGVLGTFDLGDGTLLAREAEAFYANGALNSAGVDGRLAQVAAELRAMLDRKK